MNQVLFLDEVHLLPSGLFLAAQSVGFTTTTIYVDPISDNDSMFRTVAELLQLEAAFDKD